MAERLEQIQFEFNKQIENDSGIKSFRNKMEAYTATQQDASLYARRLGELASKSLIDNLTDVEMSIDILKATVRPLMITVYNIVNEAAKQIQVVEDKRDGIGIKAVKADFPEDRLDDIMYKLMLEIENGNE